MDFNLDWFIDTHRPQALTSWSTHQDDEHTQCRFEFAHISLSFTLSQDISNDTYQIADIGVRDCNGAVRRRDLDPIRHDVRQILSTLGSAAQSSRLQNTCVIILQSLERIAEYEEGDNITAGAKVEKGRHNAGWDAAKLDSWDEVISNPYGLDVSTIKDTANHLLGQTPEQLVEEISGEFRIVHMESVIRPDLLHRFLLYQRELAQELSYSGGPSRQTLLQRMAPNARGDKGSNSNSNTRSMRREDIVADMVRPRVTFHGTPMRSVRSIIRHGFLKPGRLVDGKVVASPRSGIPFDRGIYSSPSAGYALSYAVGTGEQQRVQTPLGMLPSLRLFVCATIMGRTYTQGNGAGGGYGVSVHGDLVAGHDSHFDGGFEYIIHDERAMLPCYVIHLDLGCSAAREAVMLAQRDPVAYQRQVYAARERRLHPKLAATALAPGDRKRAQEARKAAAMKWFPYGYGTAQGTRFVVEEVGEISDDEEDYGEWQHDKHAYLAVDKEGHSLGQDERGGHAVFGEDVGSGTKALFLDGYQMARH